MATFDISAGLGEVRVKLDGKIYVEDASSLRERLLEVIGAGQNRFIIDMGRVTYIDSSGLGVLVAIHKRALETGGGVVIKDVKGAVKELFSLTRLNRVFEMM